MTWATRTGAVVVDPDAGQPPLLGSVWTRREPSEDGSDPYDSIRVVGVLELSPDHPTGPAELCVTAEAGFGPCLSCTPESLTEAYRRVGSEPDDVGARIDARLRELSARGLA